MGPIHSGLRSLRDDGKVAEVRGDGAVWAVGLRPDQSAPALRDAMLERGVIPRPSGESTLAFFPPLVIDNLDIDRRVAALEEVT